MKYFVILSLFVFVKVPVHGVNVVVYSTITNNVLFYKTSREISNWIHRTDVVILDSSALIAALPTVKVTHWKIDNGTVIEMTQDDKDAVDAAAAALVISDTRTGSKDTVDIFSIDGVLLRGLAFDIADQLNKLRRKEYGQIGIAKGTISQSFDSLTWVKVTGFNTVKGYNGPATSSVTVQKASNQITVNKTGVYLVTSQFSMSADVSTGWRFAIHVDSSIQDNASAKVEINSNGDNESVFITSLIDITSNDAVIDLRFRNLEATSKNATIEEAQLVVHKVQRLSDITKAQAKQAIKDIIDSGDAD